MSSEGLSEESEGSSEPGLRRVKSSKKRHDGTRGQSSLLSSASRLRSPVPQPRKQKSFSPGQHDVIYDSFVSLAPAHGPGLPIRKRRLSSSRPTRDQGSGDLKRRRTAPPATNIGSAQWESESLASDEDSLSSSVQSWEDQQALWGHQNAPNGPSDNRILEPQDYYADQYRHLLNKEITRAANPFADFDIRGLKPTRVGASTWSAAEKSAFFKALELKGKRNAPEIARIVNLVKQQQDWEGLLESGFHPSRDTGNGFTTETDAYTSAYSTGPESRLPSPALKIEGKGKGREDSSISKDLPWSREKRPPDEKPAAGTVGLDAYDADTEDHQAAYPDTDESSSDESWQLYNSRIGEATGKNPFECEIYAQFLESWLRAVHTEPHADELEPVWKDVDEILLPYRDIPAAFEMTGTGEEALDLAAEGLRSRVWQKERKEEVEKFGNVAILTSDIAEEVEAFVHHENAQMQAASTEDGENEVVEPPLPSKGDYWLPKSLEESKAYAHAGQTVLDKIPAARILNLGRFLELSRNVFMNPGRDIEIPNWRAVAQEDEEPSMFYSAFEDFYRIALMITKRVVQATIFRARERLAQFPRTDGKALKPLIRKEDVWDALDLVGMEPRRDWEDKYRSKYWLDLPRRCGLVVYFRSADIFSRDPVRPLTDDQVAIALRNTRKQIVDPRLDYRRRLPRRKRHNSMVEGWDSRDRYADIVVSGAIERLHDLYPARLDLSISSFQRSRPTTPKNDDPEHSDTMIGVEDGASDMDSDIQADIHDQEESYKEQQRLLELLQIPQEFHPEPEKFHAPSKPIFTEKTAADFRQEDWYRTTSYTAEWERRWPGKARSATPGSEPSVHERDSSEERELRLRNRPAELSSVPSTPSRSVRSVSVASIASRPRGRRGRKPGPNRRAATRTDDEEVLPSIETGVEEARDRDTDSDESMAEAESVAMMPVRRSLSQRRARDRATSAISSVYEEFPESDSNPSGSGDDFVAE